MGCAWTLEDVCEANTISVDTNKDFLKCLIEYGSSVLHKRWVLQPTRTMNVSDQEAIFYIARFNGCIGSSDNMHITMLKYQWAQSDHI